MTSENRSEFFTVPAPSFLFSFISNHVVLFIITHFLADDLNYFRVKLDFNIFIRFLQFLFLLLMLAHFIIILLFYGIISCLKELNLVLKIHSS